jgi:hypothetical protein
MRTATGLTLIAVGAIFTFAITASPSWLNVQIVGVVLMATGAAGLFMPGKAQGWLRRRMVVRRGPRGPVVSEVRETLPPYISINPGATADAAEQPGIPVERTVVIPTTSAEDLMAQRRNHADGTQPAGAPPQGTEIVDEYFEE